MTHVTYHDATSHDDDDGDVTHVTYHDATSHDDDGDVTHVTYHTMLRRMMVMVM